MNEGVEEVDFGRYRLLPEQRLLMGGGVPIPLGGRAFDILVALVERRKEIVSKAELMRRVWGGQAVEENTLAVHLSALRKALGDGKQGNRYIRTVPGRGYQFLASSEAGEAAEPAPARHPMGCLPRALDALIGRDAELGTVSAMLALTPLVTLTGPGGIGKTRLALAIGERVAAAFPDGVCWIDLTPIGDAALVSGTVARILGLPLGDAPALPAIKAALAGQRRLLILDNCEHVATGAAELAAGLRDVEGIRLLATSLEPLGVAGEQVERLERLALPDPNVTDPAIALESPSVQLLVARAQATAQHFELDDGNLGAVIRICRRLEGIPLALELTAARVALLGTEPVAQRLDERLLDLSSGRRDVLPRHQNLRALMAWSYGLLSSAERVVLRRLAAFAGGWSLEAAEAVVADAAVPEWQIAEHMASLIGKSLVISERGARGVRYRLLETTRAYAHERLVESGELPDVVRRHAEHLYRAFQQADAALESMVESEWAAQWWPELDNLRTVLDDCFAAKPAEALGVALTAASAELWRRLGLEGRQRIETAWSRLCAATPPDIASALWLGHSRAAAAVSDLSDALRSAEQALDLARRSRDPVRITRAAFAAEQARLQQGRHDGAPLEEIRQLSIKNGLTKNLMRVDVRLGAEYIQDGKYDLARAALHRAEALNRVLQDSEVAADILDRRALLHAVTGDLRGALAVAQDGLAGAHRRNDLDLVARIRTPLSSLLVLTGEIEAACDTLAAEPEIGADHIDGVSDLIRFLLLHLAGEHAAEAARLHGFIDARWPHLATPRSLSGEFFARAGRWLEQRLSPAALAAHRAEGAALSLQQAQLLAAAAPEALRGFVAIRRRLSSA